MLNDKTALLTGTFSIARVIHITNDKGVRAAVDLSKVPADKLGAFLVDAALGGMQIAGINSYNSGGKDKTKDEKSAQLAKRIKAWEAGEWTISGREGGQRVETVAWEEYVAALAAENGVTVKQMADHLDGMVKAAYGKDAKLNFDNRVNAICKSIADESKTDIAAERGTWEGKWIEVATAKLAEAEATKAKLETATITLKLK